MSETPQVVPDDVDEQWSPPGYEPGPDDPGPVTTAHDEAQS
jgi:hypothetical protein